MLRFAPLLLLVPLFAFAETPPAQWAVITQSSPRVPPPPPVPQKGWPKEVPMPAGMKAYTPTRLSQRIAVTNNAPSHFWYDLTRDDPHLGVKGLNPNRRFPYAVSGGMDGLSGWKSVKMASIPDKVSVYRANIPIFGAGQALPGWRWHYPDGTVFADVLTNDRDEIFELRTRTKTGGAWQSVVAYEDATVAPKGYKGAGKACASCHRSAGASEQYGTTVRGNDTIFSHLPLVR